jgi:hypothetical protein
LLCGLVFFRNQRIPLFLQKKKGRLSIIRKAYNSIFSDDKELSKYVRAITGITPSKLKIYKQVFRHRSAYVSAKENNERLELLGRFGFRLTWLLNFYSRNILSAKKVL